MIRHAGRKASEKIIIWDGFPGPWEISCKDVIFAFGNFAPEGGRILRASGIPKRAIKLRCFVRWLSDLGVIGFSNVNPSHIRLYVLHLSSLRLSPRSIRTELSNISLIFKLGKYLQDGFLVDPLGGNRPGVLAEVTTEDDAPVSKTRMIPLADLSRLFIAAERTLKDAPRILKIRDNFNDLTLSIKGVNRQNYEIARRDFVKSNGYSNVDDFNADVIDIRTACYIILAISTGCRVHELGDCETGCIFRKDLDGVELIWLRTFTRKIGVGEMKWLATEIAEVAVSILEWQSRPLRSMLNLQSDELKREYSHCDTSRRASISHSLEVVERDQCKLFLGQLHTNSLPAGISNGQHNSCLNSFALRHGVALPDLLATHRFRKTYAVILVRLNKGIRIDLLALKEQFKHGTIMMSELYTQIDEGDEELMRIIEEEESLLNENVLTAWLEPTAPLAGGAAPRFRKFRDKYHQVVVVADRRKLIASISEQMNLRATGHSWCVSDASDCGGQGLFAASRCAGCNQGVIDETHRSVWAGIYSQQLELEKLDDMGPGGRLVVARSKAAADTVLTQLGYPGDER
jgi:integrase